jgi:hypothetical protein
VIPIEGILIDELKLYRGEDFKVNDHLTIHIPTLGEICDYGEAAYFSMVYTFTSTPADLMWQLDDLGIDYTKITDWELFYSILYPQFHPSRSHILFGDFDFSSLQQFVNTESKEISLEGLTTNQEQVTIDYYTYLVLTEFLRKIHGIKKNEKKPANETTRQILIEDAREETLRNKNREYHSSLRNLISSMINSSGFKSDHNTVWDMKINVFLDSVARIQKIQNSQLLLQSGYSGFGIDLKKVSSKQLDWLGELF